jgi:hypothetical protein
VEVDKGGSTKPRNTFDLEEVMNDILVNML